MQKPARERLRDYGRRLGYNQGQLARLLGITDAYLSQILNGLRRPGFTLAAKIQRVTGIPAVSWVTSRLVNKKPRVKIEATEAGVNNA